MVKRQITPRAQEASEEVYALSITAVGDYVCLDTAGTQWLENSADHYEVRQATAYANIEPWRLLKECWIQVEDLRGLLDLLTLGGHGLVKQMVIHDWWPDFFAPIECFHYSDRLPFIGRYHLPPGAEERHPSSLIRKRVLARDEYRCRVCGHSPDDHPAIKLEIHHVFEHALGGLTVEDNLLTLCRNCHENATPPDAWLRADMYERVFVAASRFHRRSYEQGVADYRTCVSRALGRKEAEEVKSPLEDLIYGPDYHNRYENWYLAYMVHASNSVLRYFTLNEWRRILPAELRRR